MSVGAEPLVANCRAVEISQVLLNLIGNAVDAVEDAQDKWLKIAVLDLGPFIEIAVTDSGRGISEAARKKLFQPFFTTKEIGKGTGLGLSISQGIMVAHKGEIRFDLNSPHTRFVVRLLKNPGLLKVKSAS